MDNSKTHGQIKEVISESCPWMILTRREVNHEMTPELVRTMLVVCTNQKVNSWSAKAYQIILFDTQIIILILIIQQFYKYEAQDLDLV